MKLDDFKTCVSDMSSGSDPQQGIRDCFQQTFRQQPWHQRHQQPQRLSSPSGSSSGGSRQRGGSEQRW